MKIDIEMNQSCERERDFDFEIDKSKFQTRKFHLKIGESEFETLRISPNFNNRISQSFRTRSKLINSKIDESRNSNFWPRIYGRWRTTNSLKMKQRTFYNVFENGPRVAGGKRRCDSCEFQGVQRFSNFFRGMPAPWPPYAKTERRENSLRVNCLPADGKFANPMNRVWCRSFNFYLG